MTEVEIVFEPHVHGTAIRIEKDGEKYGCLVPHGASSRDMRFAAANACIFAVVDLIAEPKLVGYTGEPFDVDKLVARERRRAA